MDNLAHLDSSILQNAPTFLLQNDIYEFCNSPEFGEEWFIVDSQNKLISSFASVRYCVFAFHLDLLFRWSAQLGLVCHRVVIRSYIITPNYILLDISVQD